MLKCIIILSYKSSGSSVCQRLLTQSPNINHVNYTRHFEFETLYWTKAASILGLPQNKMLNSEVPIPAKRAREEVIFFLRENGVVAKQSADELAMLFDGWQSLCEVYSPVFLEKSPHHLSQPAVLKLINQCAEAMPHIQFHFIGLIRNPMDTLYSAYKRWKTIPELGQDEWRIAYQNLLAFKNVVKHQLTIIRYEDLVQSFSCLQPVFDFAGVNCDELDSNTLHRRAMQKWRSDSRYGFQLNGETAVLAQQFGYLPEQLTNKPKRFWPLYRDISVSLYKIVLPQKAFVKKILKVQDKY